MDIDTGFSLNKDSSESHGGYDYLIINSEQEYSEKIAILERRDTSSIQKGYKMHSNHKI